ncbi:MAG: HAMP domain-containing protein [Nevskiaceae bacterium]|nr:MAG: HAMP domain-containing protein [Nevskiaceae bacterium]
MKGITIRLHIIMLVALAMIFLACVPIILSHKPFELKDPDGSREPLAKKIAAVVELLDATPNELVPKTIHILNMGTIRYEVADQLPPRRTTWSFPLVEMQLRHYLPFERERFLWIGLDEAAADDPMADATASPTALLRMIVELNNGTYLVISERDVISKEVPIYLGATALQMVIALTVFGLLCVLLVRQMRPVVQVAEAVSRFGQSFDEAPLQISGPHEVTILVAAFNRMRAQIRRLLEGRTRMLAAVNHDLATYLTRLSLRVEQVPDASLRTRLSRDIEQMKSLTANTLTLARIGETLLPNTRINLQAVVRQHVEDYSEHGGAVFLERSYSCVLRGDSLALGRVLSNLIDNALKFAGAAYLVLQPCTAAGRAEIELLVDDAGPGISPATRSEVLLPFQRGDAARNLNAAGSGLGLAISADIVAWHQGTLTLEESPRGGLRVRLRFPDADPDRLHR